MDLLRTIHVCTWLVVLCHDCHSLPSLLRAQRQSSEEISLLLDPTEQLTHDQLDKLVVDRSIFNTPFFPCPPGQIQTGKGRCVVKAESINMDDFVLEKLKEMTKDGAFSKKPHSRVRPKGHKSKLTTTTTTLAPATSSVTVTTPAPITTSTTLPATTTITTMKSPVTDKSTVPPIKPEIIVSSTTPLPSTSKPTTMTVPLDTSPLPSTAHVATSPRPLLPPTTATTTPFPRKKLEQAFSSSKRPQIMTTISTPIMTSPTRIPSKFPEFIFPSESMPHNPMTPNASNEGNLDYIYKSTWELIGKIRTYFNTLV